MNREEFLDSLAYLVERYEDTEGAVGISQAEASRLIELYDDGEINRDELPLPLAAAVAGRRAQLLVEAARRSTEAMQELARQVAEGETQLAGAAAEEASDTATEAATDAAGEAGGGTAGGTDRATGTAAQEGAEEAGEEVSEDAIEEAADEIRESGILSEDPPAGGPGPSRNVDIDSRRRFTITVMEDFDGDVFDDARAVTQGMDAETWHERMLDRVRRDLLQQARLGKGSPLTADELADLQEVMDDQSERLKRFADEIAARNELADNAEEVARRQLRDEGEDVTEEAVEELAEGFRDRRMTEDQIAARSRMYKGRGYRAFWEKAEESATGGRSDMIVRYRAQDDSATCIPCQTAEANSPYLAGSDHPYPGSVCLGGGHCRCSLDFQQAPETAAQLRGE